MLHQLISDLKLYKGNLSFLLPIILIAFVLGLGLAFLLIAVDGDGTYWAMGTLAALLCCILLSLGVGLTFAKESRLALSMGRTRLEFISSYALRYLLDLVVIYVVILLLHRLELTLYSIWYPGYENTLPLSFLTNWRVILPTILGLLLLNLFFGVLSVKLGAKFYPVIYFIPCVVAWINLYFRETYDQSVVTWLANLFPAAVWTAAAVVTAIAMLGTVIHLGRKLQVR